MDEESVKHKVVMMLIDILVSGQQPITVKELVSRMGHNDEYASLAKGLRRIIGRGLDGFPGILVLLWQFPSIFTVKKSEVSMTGALAVGQHSDEWHEWHTSHVAIDFYEFQLRRFGAYLVPISQLFDTRNQSSKYVKSVTGNNVQQFTAFLSTHADVFKIVDDCVVLCQHVQRAAINGNTITRIDAPIVLDVEVYANTRIIVNTFHGNQIVDTIFEMTDVVTVDLEGVCLGSVNGYITLVQIAYLPKHDMNGVTCGQSYPKIYIFDICSNRDLVPMCLKRLLESDRIRKVLHGCEDDSYALYRDFGVLLNNFIDTQVAHTVINCTLIDENCDIKASRQSEAIGLNSLFELYGGYGSNPLKAVVKKRYVGNSRYWGSRPLSQEMIYYAAYDVYVLLGIYLKMCAYISKIEAKCVTLLNDLNIRAAFGRIWSEQDRHV